MVGKSEDRLLKKLLLQSFKRNLSFVCPDKVTLFFRKLYDGIRNFCEVFDVFSIVIGHAQEASYLF